MQADRQDRNTIQPGTYRVPLGWDELHRAGILGLAEQDKAQLWDRCVSFTKHSTDAPLQYLTIDEPQNALPGQSRDARPIDARLSAPGAVCGVYAAAHLRERLGAAAGRVVEHGGGPQPSEHRKCIYGEALRVLAQAPRLVRETLHACAAAFKHGS